MDKQPKTSSKPPFLAFAKDGADIGKLKEFAKTHEWGESCVLHGDITTAAEYLKTNISPVLLLVEITSAEAAPSLLDALADVCDPDTKVIIIGTVNEYSFYCWLTEIGIFSYLLRPFAIETLEATYQKSIVSAPVATAVEVKKPAKVIAVIGARGGVGASTIALNLSGIFAEYSEQKIALVDIDPQEGTLSLMLDIEPARGLRDALEKPDRIDALFIDRVMSKPHKNLWVMSAEEPLQERINISDQTAENLIAALKDKYDVIVLDVPRQLTQFSRDCLKKTDAILLVAELNLQCLRDVLRLSDLIHENLKNPLPLVVANRVGIAPKNEISAGDFEKGISLKIAEKIPYNTDIYMQISSDIPAIANIKNTDVQPLIELARQLLPEMPLLEKDSRKDFFAFLKKKKE